MFMGRTSRLFGVELRRRRVEAGLSLEGLARRVHYSKGHLSKVENGVKGPGDDPPPFCDAALGCGGALITAARRDEVSADAADEDDAGRASDGGNTIEVMVFDLN